MRTKPDHDDLRSRHLPRNAGTPEEAAAHWRAVHSRGDENLKLATNQLATVLLAVAIPKVRRTLLYYLRDDANSVAGLAVMRVIRIIASYRAQPGRESALMRRAARTVAIDHNRKYGGGGSNPGKQDGRTDHEPVSAECPADEAIARRELRADIRKLLGPDGPLPAQYRAVLVRHYLDGVPVAQFVAEEVGRREARHGRRLDREEQQQARNVVDRTLSRARAALREQCARRKLSPDG